MSRERPAPTSSPRSDAAGFSRLLDEAAAHFSAGRLDAAAQVYRRLERAAPDDVRAAYSLSVIDIRQGRLDQARRRLEAITARVPALVAAQHNLGSVRQQLGLWREAAEAYGRALDLRPDATETRAALATALAVLGRAGEAIAHHRVLASDPPRRTAALTRIALIDAAALTDEDLAALQAAATDAALDPGTRIGACFALGDALEARDRPGPAFDAYAEGNRLKRGTLDSLAVAAANAAAARHVRALVTPRFVAERAEQGSSSAAPIFIVGFPRSGSTLIEQILASHPSVQGLGETGVFPALALHGYPKTAAGFRDLAARYLAALGERGWNGTARFVDKTLENYLHAGLIAALFPRATILHAVRDPVDTGFACYRQLFASGNETLYDLEDIAAEHRRYGELMDHWRAVMPGRIVDIGYEALVADPNAGIPRLVAAAGLDWDPAVLAFHQREAAVRTASASQVRRPIYRSSVQRWRRHAARLQPLIAGLDLQGGISGSGANDGT